MNLLRIIASSPEPILDRVLVPVKTKQANGIIAAGLTDAMYSAFWDAFDEAYKHHGHKESTSAGYEAMIKARPRG